MENKTKILLFAYTKVNLGDNLFIYLLLKRYPNIDFYIHVVEKEYEKVYQNFENLHYLYENRDFDKIHVEDFDAYLYVGGSIFMESEYARHELKEVNKFVKRCNEKNKKFFYMSCNFGPYQTEEYLNLAKETYSLCGGICFRDKKSYNLFKEIPQVRQAPDMAFTLPVENVEKEKNTIGISVISLAIREDLKEKEGAYNDFIKRIIIKFAKRNYQVTLFGFSEFEKDSEAIQTILSTVPDEYKNNVHVEIFKENIEKYIEKYAKMEYMVCGRFHSMILSMLYGQKIYNLTYSKKQETVIEESKFFSRYQPIREMNYETVLRKYYFKKASNYKLKKVIKEAENQFKDLEDWLHNKE